MALAQSHAFPGILFSISFIHMKSTDSNGFTPKIQRRLRERGVKSKEGTKGNKSSMIHVHALSAQGHPLMNPT